MYKAIIKTTVATHIINNENLEKVLEAIRDYNGCPELEEVKLFEEGNEIPQMAVDLAVHYGDDCEIIEAWYAEAEEVYYLRVRWFSQEGVEFIDEVTYTPSTTPTGRWGYWDGDCYGLVPCMIEYRTDDPGTVLVDDEDEDELPF